jgi:hypothetical protein
MSLVLFHSTGGGKSAVFPFFFFFAFLGLGSPSSAFGSSSFFFFLPFLLLGYGIVSITLVIFRIEDLQASSFK